MAIDASIPLQVRPAEDPISQYSKLAQLQNMQTQGKLADAQLQGQQRAVERQNKLAQLLAQGGSPDQLEGSLRQGGFLDESLKFGRDRRENVKLDAETGAKRQESGIKANEAIGQTLGALMRIPGVGPQQVAASMQQLVDAGVLPPELAQKIVAGVPQDPAQIPAFLQMGRDRVMSAKEQRQYTDVDANARLSADTSRQNNAASVDIQRDRLNFDKEKDKRDGSAGGKAPAGYRFKPDGSLEAIRGGPADIKAGELGEKRERQQQGAVAQADRIISKVDQALEKVGITSAGVGGAVMSGIPGTDARNLRADLDTIKANLGFAELQAMRDASPTGGALGAIAVQELVALQSTVASLDQAQDGAQLKARLGEIKKHYENWKAAVAPDAPKGGASGSFEQPKGMPSGFKVIRN